MIQLRVSLVFAAITCAANVWAAVQFRNSMRWVYVTVAALAAVYVLGYSALLSGRRIWIIDGTDRAVWSVQMSNVAYLVWPLVWTLPAVRGASHERRLRREANRALREYSADVDEG